MAFWASLTATLLLAAQVAPGIVADPARPVMPTAAMPPPLDPAICSTTEGRGTVRRQIVEAEDSPDGAMGMLKLRSEYRQRLADWKTARLEKSGRVSKARIAEIVLHGFMDGPVGDPMANLKLIEEMMPIVDEATARDKAGDQVGACASSLKLFALVERIDALTAKQWSTIDAALDGEAKRVGVSLD